MKRWALVAGLVVWALLAVVAWQADGRAARAQGDSDDAGRYVVIGVILYDRQLEQEVYVYNANGYATATPRDPVATATPRATDPPQQPSPTPSVTPDTAPQPTPIGGGEKACLATSSAAINLRADHSTSAPILDNIDPSARMTVLRFWVISDVTDEWLQVRAPARSGAVREGWVYRGSSVFVGVDDTEELCWDVPVDGPGAAPTPAPTATSAPPMTPVPTGPAPGDCTYSHIYAMTMRSGPGTGYSRVGTLPANTRAPVGHIYPDTASEQWAFITYEGVTGWVAARAGGVTYGALSGDCAGVRRDAPRLDNPRGLHLIYSANREVVQRALPTLGTLKATDGAEWALAAAKQHDPRIVTVYRAIYTPWGKLDCPPNWGVGDPAAAADAWYDMLLGVWSARGTREVADYHEYRNECLFVGDWEIAFDLRMVERANASGVCLLLFSDAPGNPEIAQFAQRRPVLDAALAQECRPGVRHGIAHHVYFGRSSGPWLFGRWQLFAAALGSKYDALDWWITEYGMPAQDGTVIGRGAADCAAARAEMDAADAIFRADGRVGGYHAYSVGASQEWTDITPCLGAL